MHHKLDEVASRSERVQANVFDIIRNFYWKNLKMEEQYIIQERKYNDTKSSIGILCSNVGVPEVVKLNKFYVFQATISLCPNL
jgi:hypothetical protein